MKRFGRKLAGQAVAGVGRTFGLSPINYGYAVDLLKAAGDRASFAESGRILRKSGITVSDGTVRKIAYSVGFSGRGRGAWGKEHRWQTRVNEVFGYAASRAKINPQTGRKEVALSLNELAKEFGGQERKYGKMLLEVKVLLATKKIVLLRKTSINDVRARKGFERSVGRVTRFVEHFSGRGIGVSPRLVSFIFGIAPKTASSVLAAVASDEKLIARLGKKGKKVLVVARVLPNKFNIAELRQKYNKD